LTICSLFVWLVANSWCWFVLREKYYWLIASGWFVLRDKYCWLVADKPSEQGANYCLPLVLSIELQNCVSSTIQLLKPFTIGYLAVLMGGFNFFIYNLVLIS
jgi:hypothetical protein